MTKATLQPPLAPSSLCLYLYSWKQTAESHSSLVPRLPPRLPQEPGYEAKSHSRWTSQILWVSTGISLYHRRYMWSHPATLLSPWNRPFQYNKELTWVLNLTPRFYLPWWMRYPMKPWGFSHMCKHWIPGHFSLLPRGLGTRLTLTVINSWLNTDISCLKSSKVCMFMYSKLH